MNAPGIITNGHPVSYEKEIGEIMGHLGQTHVMMEQAGLSRALSHLIELRVSQINQCGYCVKMHSTDARKDNETDKRLDRLAVWNAVSDFTDAEKAAFAWAEALTYLDRGTDFAPLRAALRAHYNEQQISLITTCVAMINLWNRVQISRH